MCNGVFLAAESWKSRDCLQQYSAFSFVQLKSLSSAIKRNHKFTFCKSNWM